MPSARKYLPQDQLDKPARTMSLPLDRDVAVYYRQSSMKQVGNVSTEMQQVDLPRYVNSLGWSTDQIILIDEDEGVSGAKRIDQRKGMSRLYDMMISGKIGTVAAQAEDRLFRDETQIQVNVFIEACVQNDVRVITPYFKYNFADKYEGHYHRLLFRTRAEQAADFLNSYVRGRLFAAKERMTMQGLWIGGNINLGYMVDDRKTLATGIPNPNWRKYEPFEPCAKVVNELFEIFVRFNGNARRTLAHIYEHGPHFPDFDTPEFRSLVPAGFMCKKPLRMLKRGGYYTPGRMALLNMMTNVVYIGHWHYKDRIVQWNNHPPIVPEELFFRAFNYLSRYTITGKDNPDYVPAFHSDRFKAERDAAKPVFKGLIGTYWEGEWKRASAAWTKGMGAYAYVVMRHDLATNQQRLWSRRCDYFDEVLAEMLLAKLRSTFDPKVWDGVLAESSKDFARERRSLTAELKSNAELMGNLRNNIPRIKSQSLVDLLELDYKGFADKHDAITQKLENLERRVQRQDTMVRLAKQADYVLANWHSMSVHDQRTVAHAFLVRIVVTPTGKRRAVNVEMQWRDDSTDSFMLPYRSDKWTLWTSGEVQTLKQLIERNANQVEIAAALPDRKWRSIRIKIYEVTGTRSFQIAPKVIRDSETYAAYLERAERKEKSQRHTGSARWQEAEMQKLDELLNVRATQLEITAALPYRSWQAIRRRITLLRGPGFVIPETGQLADGETYEAYLTRNPSAASAMSFQASMSSEPQTRC